MGGVYIVHMDGCWGIWTGVPSIWGYFGGLLQSLLGFVIFAGVAGDT